MKSFVFLALLALIACGDGGDDLTIDANGQVISGGQGGGGQNPGVGAAPVLTFRVINTFPHDTGAFTQGLVFSNGRFFESTGLTGQSTLREVEIATGNVVRTQNLDATLFGEGLALRAGSLYQLTLNSGNTLVWDQGTFTLQRTLATPTPSWGLAYDATNDLFAFSNGTSTIRFLDPTTFNTAGSISVTDNGQPVDALNELEYVNGLLYANRFLTDEIVVINPTTGVLVARINLNGIIDKQANNLGFNDVLNGIAFDPAGNRLFVTGKRWPFLYQIEVVNP